MRGVRGIPVTLTRVLYVPDLGARLLSISGIYERGGSVQWDSQVVRVYGREPGPHLLECRRRDEMWYLESPVITSTVSDPTTAHCLSCTAGQAASGAARERPEPWELWHRRLAHVSPAGLAALRSHRLVEGMQLRGQIPKQHTCAACFRGKMAQQPFPPGQTRVTTPFAVVGMDLLGKLERESARSRARYMLLLKDAATGFCWSYFLRKKKDAVRRIQSFFSHVERQYSRLVLAFRSDRGGEFLSAEFVDWLDQLGVVHQLTVPYTPQQNGMVERANRTLCGRARAMLYAAGLPKRFWEHALRYAVWATNRVPSRRLGATGTPYAALHGRRPDVSRARVFGCLAHVFVPAAHRRKLDDRAVLGVFLGMAEDTKGYEFWVPETGQFLISRSAVFHEELFLRDSPQVDQACVIVPPDDLLESAQDESLFPAHQSLSKDSERAAQLLARPPWSEPGPALPQDTEQQAPVPPPAGGPSHPPTPVVPPHSGPPGEGESARDPADRASRQPRVTWSDQLEHVHRYHPESFSRVTEESVPPSSGQQYGRYTVLADLPDEIIPPADEGLPAEDEVTCPRDILPVVDPPVSQPEAVPAPELAPVQEESADTSGTEVTRTESESVSPTQTVSTAPVQEVAQDQGEPIVLELMDAQGQGEHAARPQRVRQPPLHFSPVMRGQSHHIYRRAGTATAFLSSVPPERWKVPKGYQAALRSPESERWQDAMQVEHEGLLNMGAWELVERPQGANVLRSLWVYALKLNPDNTIERFKARLVIDGSQQKEGVDYEDTYASTAGRCTVRVFMALAVCRDWVVHQLDVSQAFLYGEVDRDVYMHQPQGFSDGTHRVCKLRRSLYGLKQAPRIWSEHLRGTMLELGFSVSPMDPALYFIVRDGATLGVLDWVDDMLMGSPSTSLVQWFKEELGKRYKVKDLGPAQKYVGFEFHWDRVGHRLFVHQAHYCLEVFERYGDSSAPFPPTPLPADFRVFYPWEILSPDDDPEEPPAGRAPEPPLPPGERQLYQQLVGVLNYAAHCARPDVNFAASVLSQVGQKPRARHLAAARRAIQYLGGTAAWSLCYSKADPFLEAYCDASLGPTGSSHNHTGILLTVAGGPVSWTSRKQDRKTTSTCDSEALAVMSTVQHVLHMRDLLSEFGAVQSWPTPLYNDNTACVRLCVEPRSHHKSLQLTRPMAMVRQITHDGFIAPEFVRTTQMPADCFTKQLDRVAFERCREQMGMAPLPADVRFSTFPSSGET